MIEPLPDELARLFASERATPAPDAARQAAVRARLWKTLGFGGAPGGGGGLGTGAAVLAVVIAAGTFVLARHDPARPATSPSATTTSAPSTANATTNVPPRLAPGVAAPEAAAQPTADWMGQLDVPQRSIEGVVTYGGKPLPGAEVTLSSASTGPGGAPLLRVVTADDGRFHFGDQPAWSYAVVAEHAGMTPASATVDLRGKDGNVTLALADCSVRVRGSVRDSFGGALGGARVMALISPWHGPSTTSDANGDFALCVTPTKSRLRFSAESYGSIDRVVEPGATVEVTLARENYVVGSVVGPDGKPRAGVQVNLWHRPGSGGDAHGVTDGDGHFEIGGVAAGHYGITAWTRDAIAWTPYQIDVVDGLVEPLSLRVDATARIHGVVVRDGRRLAGADVVASREGSNDFRSHHAISQDDGSFTLNGVPVGDVAILVDGREVTSLAVTLDGASGLYVDAGVP